MPLRTEESPDRVATRVAARYLGVAFVIVACGVAFIVASSLLSRGSFVERMAVDNPSPYPVDVRLAGDRPDGWMPIGTAQPDKVTTFEHVYDQGPTWTIELRIGTETKTITASRSDLRRAGWRIDVPKELIARVRAP